jgi:aminopeptidase N
MRSHPTSRSPWTLPVSIVLLIAMLALPLLAQSAPMSADDIERHAREIREHRTLESQLKQEHAIAGLMADFERTFNQDQFDVQHYDLSMDLNTTSNTLTGDNIVTALVVGADISTLELDLASNLTVSAATSDGAATTWSHVGGLVTIDLDRVYVNGETVTVSLDYSGNPSAGGAFGWNSYGGSDMIWTLSEPYGARTWWPCKDVNTDKSESMDIRVTVPDNLIVASNGNLLSDVDNGNGTRSFHWHTDHPIVPYLVSLAIHPYAVNSDWYTPQAGGDDMEVRFYVFPDQVGDAAENHAKVVPMLDAMVPAFGEYPFVDEKYGHAQFLWGGGMEHQTMTSMGGFWESVIAHELGHQWWGDEITCADFGHIWLNEGFASWSEAVWFEDQGGPEAYRQYMDTMAYYGGGTVIVENPYSDNIFDGNLSYDKGAWLVHMLRGQLGDTDFFAGLAEYRNQYGGGSATSEQLRDVLEGVSGKDLDAFITQWVYGEYFPVYRMEWSETAGGVDLTVEQIQDNTGLFTMDLPVRVTTDQGVTDFMVPNSLVSEDYFLAVSGVVESVQLDPDHWILRQVQTSVNNPTFADGILLVNGVEWDTYMPEIQNAYEAEAFWGDNEIDFWDTFNAPGSGYPSTLPAPLGHGSVPAEVIGAYSTVIWVGNNYLGDLPKWQETPILSYLEVGGNVLLMTRRGQSFIGSDLETYLGINFIDDGGLGDCTATYLGLADIPFTGSQTYNDVFTTSVGPNSTLLFKDTSGFGVDRGTGVHVQPPGGGSARPEGGQFIYLAGRPYRMNHDALRGDVEFMLESFFLEPWTSTGLPGEEAAAAFRLAGNFPNPFNPKTTIRFDLPKAGLTKLAVYDVTGRLLRTLHDGRLAAGSHAIDWDGRDDAGKDAAAGVYLYRLLADGHEATERMVLLK